MGGEAGKLRRCNTMMFGWLGSNRVLTLVLKAWDICGCEKGQAGPAQAGASGNPNNTLTDIFCLGKYRLDAQDVGPLSRPLERDCALRAHLGIPQQRNATHLGVDLK